MTKTSAKVFLDELTWREANEAIERDAPAFLPIGPTEGHGPNMPLGCDYYIATGIARLLAEKTDGIVLPPLQTLREYGIVGYHYTHELQHVPQRADIDVELGVEFLNDVAERLLPVVAALGEYVEWLEKNPKTFITPSELA